MPEDTGAPPPAGGAPEPQAGTPPAPPAGEPQQPPAGAAPSATPDLATLQRELAATRREAAGYRTKLKGFEDATKSDAEKQAEKIAELEKELATERTGRQGDRLQMAAYGAARKLGFRNPELAHRLIAPSEVEFNADGSAKNVEALLTAIAKSDPYLVSSGPQDSGLGPRGTPPSSGNDMNTAIRRATGRM